MKRAYHSENWKISLGTRNNLLFNGIPHVPMLVENISTFISFEDYKENGIKTIQTLGELVPNTETYAILSSLTRGNNSEFPVSFRNLNVNDIYIKNSDGTYCAIWNKHKVFKIYGILKKKVFGHILVASHLVPVHDVPGTWNIMTILMSTARSEYRQYNRTKGQNDMLELQWDKMKREKKRLVNEQPI
ncbi:hypothetical protein WH47_04952 [Habropoda laboriosa]|uniref:Uncharacterized protein n=1 Tax=Habropoda laboriosa TaxID=597456 RepID=A0A0L7RJQ8_9HYME|nr:PREDICTED: uncharacterized protein LOC108580012 [Habropoda laboriosa]KOC70966.1 hypothetical protein WH47_04952 [Habropoda laboriosa]